MVVAAADAQQPEQGPYRSGTSSDQPAGMGRLAWAAGAGRDLLAGPVDHARDGGQPDRRRAGLRGPLDRFQHARLPVCGEQAGHGPDQGAGLGRCEIGDPVRQRRQGIGRPTAEPPFSPPGAGRPREVPGGPTRALHNASLTST